MVGLHRLPNGVRVCMDPMPSLESAAIGVWAQAGAVDEREDEHGLAHLLEHMAFKGTARRSARDIAEEIEAVGGYLNASTSHQRTGYYARLLAGDVGLGLDILADILTEPRFAEDDLRKEKEVVIQEIGEAADTPDDVVFEALQSICWTGHPLARPILGTPDTVRAHSTDAMRAFMRRGYQPGAIIVAAAGKIDTDDFLRRVEDAFGRLAPDEEKNARTPPQFHGGVRHDKRKIEQTHFALAFPGVSSRHEDFYASRVFADALGGGMSSRLFQRIREDRGLAYSVYAFSDSYDESGLVGAYAGADADEIGDIAGAIRTEIADMIDHTGEEEIARAKAMLRASLLMGLESPAARIENAAGQLFRDDRILSPAELSERIDAVTIADIERCAARALEGPAAISMVGPGDPAAAEARLSV